MGNAQTGHSKSTPCYERASSACDETHYLHCVQAQLEEIGATSAAAHREYRAALQDMQHSVQSAQDQAADADAQGQQKAEQLEHEIQQLQVPLSLVTFLQGAVCLL